MKYTILEGHTSDLIEQVNKHLTEGWELGGVAYGMNNAHYQPMVLREMAIDTPQELKPEWRENKVGNDVISASSDKANSKPYQNQRK